MKPGTLWTCRCAASGYGSKDQPPSGWVELPDAKGTPLWHPNRYCRVSCANCQFARAKDTTGDDLVARRLVFRRAMWDVCVELGEKLKESRDLAVSPSEIAVIALEAGLAHVGRLARSPLVDFGVAPGACPGCGQGKDGRADHEGECPIAYYRPGFTAQTPADEDDGPPLPG